MSDQGVTFFCTQCRRHGSIRRCVRCDDIYCSVCNEPESGSCQHGHLKNIWPIARRLDLFVCPDCGGTGEVRRGILKDECTGCAGVGARAEVLT